MIKFWWPYPQGHRFLFVMHLRLGWFCSVYFWGMWYCLSWIEPYLKGSNIYVITNPQTCTYVYSWFMYLYVFSSIIHHLSYVIYVHVCMYGLCVFTHFYYHFCSWYISVDTCQELIAYLWDSGVVLSTKMVKGKPWCMSPTMGMSSWSRLVWT